MERPGRDDYQRAALLDTLENALKHDHYISSWSTSLRAESVSSLQADPKIFMSKLPLLTKRNLIENLPPRIERGDQISSIMHTTGSTGPIAYRYRSRRELQEIDSFYEAVVRKLRPPLRPHVLMFYGPYHGVDFGNAVGASLGYAPNIFSGAIWEDIFIRQAIDLLRREFALPGMHTRVNTVCGAIRLVRIFTQSLIDQGIDSSEFDVNIFATFAGFTPSVVRSFLRDYWRCEPIEVFSMSEIKGSGRKCPACGALSFDPQVYPEVVAFDDESLVDEGDGRFIATELLPFGRAQPLVRYYNGDLARLESRDCAICGSGRKIFHLGRENESLLIQSGSGTRLVLGSSDLREIAYCDQVARSVEFPHLKMLRDRHSNLGVPIISATVSNRAASSNKRARPAHLVELRFRPRASTTAGANAAAEELRERCLSVSNHLRLAVEEKCVDLRIIADKEHGHLLWK
jgi:phenylacetate-coenzyme A ligase PaaK-like adenylate-forming protein